METVVRAIGSKNDVNDEDWQTPRGFEVIDRVENPVDKAQLLTLMYLIYRIGPLAASMAVLAGAPMKSAYAIHDSWSWPWRWRPRKYALPGVLAGSLSPKSQGSSISMFSMRLTGSASPRLQASRWT